MTFRFESRTKPLRPSDRPARSGGAATASDEDWRHRSFRVAIVVALSWCGLAAGCAEPGPSAPPKAPPSEVEVAERLLAGDAPLPSRVEIVALADAVAIASAKAVATDEAARLAGLAADLRIRAYRRFGAEADGREAQELLSAITRAAAPSEVACDADRRRALLRGEMAHDAAVTYRELYLAERRNAPALATTRDSACLAALDASLGLSVAFRPTGQAMQALEREGERAAKSGPAAVSPPAATAAGSAANVADAGLDAAAASSANEVVVSLSAAAASKGPVKLVSIDPYGSDVSARVVVNLSGPATYTVGSVGADEEAGKDPRVFVDIAKATSKGVPREIPVKGVVRKVRVGAQEGGTRVVLDLAKTSLKRRVFYLPDPFRIVIDVGVRAEASSPAAAGGRRVVRRVAIDPGHGGVDDGAVGPTGLREKDVTLDIAHRIAPLLAHELKIETLLTRDTDVYVPLEARTARANAFHADLFVSVHCNASENGLARGVQTFVLDESRSQGFARLEARENAARGVSPSSAIDDDMAAVLFNLSAADVVARSRLMADLVQRSALGSLLQRYPDTRDQGVKTASFYVLVGADMPAVLFETAFISNPEDESRLATADYRQKMADAIANAIKAYAEGK